MPGPVLIDLHWMGRTNCIASWSADDVLVDCGPATTVDTLIEALGDRRPRALLLTHIHFDHARAGARGDRGPRGLLLARTPFDHAGAAGARVERWPAPQVWVHRRGAGPLAAPERLEASARRVFGHTFDERFGSLTPIPQDNLH